MGVTPIQGSLACGEPIEIVLERDGYLPLHKRLMVQDPESSVTFTLDPLPE